MKTLEGFIQKYLTPRGLPESLFEFDFHREPEISDSERDSSDWDDEEHTNADIYCTIRIKQYNVTLFRYSGNDSHWAVEMPNYIYVHPHYICECNIDAILDEIAKQYKLQQAYDAALAEIAELKAKVLEMELRPGGPGYENAKSHFEGMAQKQ